jgi:hypothetical protein
MDNVMISFKGNLYRRPGLDYENGASITSLNLTATDIASFAFTSYYWEAVGNKANRNFLVQQIGNILHFFSLDGDNVVKKSFIVNLFGSAAAGFTTAQIQAEPVQMAAGKGFLFVVSKAIYPFVVEYNSDTDTITTNRIYIQIRDFDGLDDGQSNDEETAALGTNHKYNLYNQGWLNATNDGATGFNVSVFDNKGQIITKRQPPDTPIAAYFTALARYPSNVQQWWVAKDTSNNFDPVKLSKFAFGQSKAPRGRYILDAFNKDRSAFSGVPTIPVETTTDQPISVAFFAGRVWYVSGSNVYFSQILTNKFRAGACYQEADPTAEDISDLIDTDGGVIPIPEMVSGFRLIAAGVGIVVFGGNGIWFISGAQSGFTATTISVQKIYNIGTSYPQSVVETKEGVFWVSDVGIEMMQTAGDSVGSSFQITTLSEKVINDFFITKMTAVNRPYIKGIYDRATSTVQWLFNDSATVAPWLYNRILNFDLKLQAFSPFSFSVDATKPRVVSVFNTPTVAKVNHPNNTSIRDMYVKYALLVPDVSGYFNLTFGYFKDYTYADFKTYDGVGIDYLSYIESGYELMDDAMRDKGANYIFCYFRRTEKNWDDTNETGYDFPSSCLFQAKFDWADKSYSSRWSTKFEAYRYVRNIASGTPPDTEINFGFPIIVTKNKVRGTGRAIQFRFESNGIGKDFDLLGWAVPYYGNTEP